MSDTKHILQALMAEMSKVVEAMPDDAVAPPEPEIPDQDQPDAAGMVGNLPVAKIENGFRLVDVRPALKSLAFVNQKARDGFSTVSSKTPLSDVSVPGWQKAVLSSAQASLLTIPAFPAASKLFLFKPKTASTGYNALAMYWRDGRWNGVLIGFSRENKGNHLYDIGGADWNSAGNLFANWCAPWPKDCPTVVLLADYYGKEITYGIEI